MHLRDSVDLVKTQKSWFWIACASLLLPVLASGIVVWRANHAARIAASETAASAKVRFTVSHVNAIQLAGMDAIATPAGFRDIAVYRGRFYLSGPSGLLEYDTEGKLLKRYRVGLELPAAELGTMSQTKSQQSELFISTEGAGVLAFDGRRFRQIRPVDSAQANTTTVLSLSTGRLLIGTEHGLLVYDGRSLAPFATELRANYITALAGVEGDLWIGTLHDGLFHSHAGQLDVFNTALPDPQILSIAQFGDAVYAGTPLGVVEFRNGRRTRVVAYGYFATSILADDRCLRVGTEDEGVVNVPLQPRGCSILNSAPIRGAIRRIATFGDEQYALTDEAVYRLDGQRVIAAASSALTNRNISALAIGQGGKIWVGYFDRGLDILEPDFEHVTHLEDDRLFCVNRIVPDATGERTAVASANGLILFDSLNRVRQVLTRKDGLIADHITDVVFRPGGMVVATAAGSRSSMPPAYTVSMRFTGLVNNHVYTVATLRHTHDGRHSRRNFECGE